MYKYGSQLNRHARQTREYLYRILGIDVIGISQVQGLSVSGHKVLILFSSRLEQVQNDQ
jgi:hypothetical protein